jgi:hypothetical protein
MDPSQVDLEALIAQTEAPSWEDPSSQLETLTPDMKFEEAPPLVGHIISQKTLSNHLVYAALNKSWPFVIPFSFSTLGPNLFLFKFSKLEHTTRILAQVTWNVNGSLLALQKWSHSATINELSLTKVPFWIQVHSLPLYNMTTKNAIAIGKGLGEFLKVEESGGILSTFRSYLRILVEIDSNKPLKPGFDFSRQDGNATWISLKYERLDVYCTDCGLLGRKQQFCIAPQSARFPERYLISLKVTIFSNLQTVHSHVHHVESFTSTAPTILGQNLNHNILLKPNKNLPPYQTHNPTADLSTHHTHTCHLPSTAGNIDIPIHIPLNALSLFQKPIPLYSTKPANNTLAPDQTTNQISTSNSLDPTNKSPAHSSTHLAFSAQHMQPTPPPKIPINLPNPSPSKPDPAKSSNNLTTNLITRKPPYNIRPPKKPVQTLKDDSLPTATSPPSSPPSKKRHRTPQPSTPSKKGPGTSSEAAGHLTPNQTSSQVFSQGSSEIIPARAFLKAARRGKKNLKQALSAEIAASFSKGDCAQSPQPQ